MYSLNPFKALRGAFSRPNKKKEFKKIRLGICAMDKKAKSKPMREILKRLPQELFEIVFFGDECILREPIEQWPVVEVLIAFYSTTFPTEKAMEYVRLRNPYMINDLEMDAVLKDRRRVYELLQSQGIDVPVHVYCEREDPSVENVIEEFDDYIIVNGTHINKPLVEKPVASEDHNIYIYYPMSAGGGSKRLFRKVDDRSSEFYPHVHELRKTGSYIYEEFVVTQGTDVKVYTVGPDYGHAEARKSPVVDGRVNRDAAGLEVRYPVILSPTEKDIARKIVTAFKQTVCGFDILRVQGRSYCCDVNGFSFVKKSSKYYDDASQILVEIMINAVRSDFNLLPSTLAPLMRPVVAEESLSSPSPGGMPSRSMSKGRPVQDLSSLSVTGVSSLLNCQQCHPSEDRDGRSSPSPSVESIGNDQYLGDKPEEEEELRCVIAIVRHGDRTPKQKMKVKVTDPKYLDYFHSYAATPHKDVKVKSKSALVRFLEVTREIINDAGSANKDVLRQLKQIKDVLERWEISGINRKLQMKPQKWDEQESFDSADSAERKDAKATEVLLILKWGGDLTLLGREQAEKLGKNFRHAMYPGVAGGGMLRLHATYRHDLKIKASDEGRVMKTAAAFTKGLLELEGPLTPILASLVTVEEKDRQMLDREGNREIREEMNRCKEHLKLLQSDQMMTPELLASVAPDCSPAVERAMLSLGNPNQTLQRMHSLIGHFCDQLHVLCKKEEESEQNAADEELALSQLPSAPAADSDSTNPLPLPPPPPSPDDGPYVDIEKEPSKTDQGRESASLSGKGAQDTSSASSSTPTIQDSGEEADRNLLAVIHRGSKANFASTSANSLDSASNFPATPIAVRPKVASAVSLYLGETLHLMADRWEKLYKDFYSAKQGMYDLSKVPDVYDSIRYEILHNSHLNLDGMEELFDLSTRFENSIVPLEYGLDRRDKRKIGSMMCHSLLQKIKYDLSVSASNTQVDMRYLLDYSHAEDLAINSLGRAVRTRLYFTSESHLYTLLNVLRYPGDGEPCAFCAGGLARLEEVAELSYLTQVVFRLFEDKKDPSKFRCEVSFSPGAVYDPRDRSCCDVAPYFMLNKSISYEQFMRCLDFAIAAGDSRSGAATPSVVDGAPSSSSTPTASPVRSSGRTRDSNTTTVISDSPWNTA